MNIFYLSHNPTECAQMHVDKHIIKMVLEQNQILSTAHRILDGKEYMDASNRSRKIKRWRLKPELDQLLYKATHMNHPSAIWARQSTENYMWLHAMTVELCKEFTHRYGKIHKSEWSGVVAALANTPVNIPIGPFTEPTPAMPDIHIVPGDSIQSYKNYYNFAKQHLHSWKNRPVPDFII